MEKEANRPKNIVIRWIKYLVSLLWESQFISTLRTPRASAKQHQQHNLVRDSCMVPSDRQDQRFINQQSYTVNELVKQYMKQYIINSVDKPNFRVSLSQRRRTTVSLETNPP